MVERFFVYHPGKLSAWRIVRRRHRKPRRADHRAQGEAGARVHQDLWGGSSGPHEEFASIIEARARERAIKRWRREWKFGLVEKTNSDWRDLAEEI
jgi:predicted GIY-YIG superfamily endonuclease